ncbi:3-keto-disaccharide hydrolase [Paraglaciecola marina]|uniref:3-keto-disaccharide hydrolase n=1 Tax=Paraglaciecola marina TaxID=2500157 RepID=UPI00105C2F42|nr:DUF1080 domain-containing protein [Paraglaciecola marina]
MKHTTILLIAATSLSLSAQGAEWTSLFNGKSLSGWKQVGGDAKYTVENGAIVGESVVNSPNSFLTTKKDYGNFIFEAEINVDQGLNSGIQFRSQSKRSFEKGRVHGYQVEIDTSERKWSGGVYEEAKRGWLYTLSRNEGCQEAFDVDKWNKYRVEAVDNQIRTWINGVPCADILDSEAGHQEGFIALQVHSISDKALAGKKVRMRSPKILTKDLNAERWYMPSHVQEINYQANTLSPKQTSEGWKLLWDGKTSKGWKGAKLDEFPAKGWGVEKGELVVYSSGGAESRNGGDIITLEEFSEFELEVDFKITDTANSGIKYFVDPNLLKGQGSAIGLEFQILHDEKHPDAKKGNNGNRTIGSLYDLIPATNLSEATRTTKRVNPVGEWNRARIVVKDGRVQHWLNNIKVVDYPRGTQIFRTLVQRSKYHKWPNFGEWETGPILLQDHGDEVRFRSIKIREL